MPQGYPLSGVVMATYSGLPEYDASFKIHDAFTGTFIVTPRLITASNGAYSTFVPAGTFTVSVITRKGSMSQDQVVANVAVPGVPTTRNINLNQVSIFSYMIASDTTLPLTVQLGQPLLIHGALYNPRPFAVLAAVHAELIDPAGNVTTVISSCAISMFAQNFFLGLFVPDALPTIPPSYIGLPYKFRIRVVDFLTQEEYDRDVVEFRNL